MDHNGFTWLAFLFIIVGLIVLVFFPSVFGISVTASGVAFIVGLAIAATALVTAFALWVGGSRSDGRERFRNKPAIVVEPLSPEGMVKYQGELWAARLEGNVAQQTIPVGTMVTVVTEKDLILIVKP